MHIKSRTGLAVLATTVGGVLAAGSIAWACSPQASLSANPRAAAANERVTVTGSSFPGVFPANPVEIRWNTSTGPVLGSAYGPSFSVDVQVPATAGPGVYYIMAISTMDGSRATTSFKVTAPTTTKAGPNTGQGATPGPTAGETDGAPLEEGAPGASPATNEAQAAGTEQTSGASGPANATTAPDTGSESTAAVTARAAASEAASGTTRSRPAVTNSATPSNPQAAPASSPMASGEPAPVAVLSAQSASGDLWSGFGTGSGRALSGPSLATDATASNGVSTVGIASGIVGLSLLVMLAGFGLAETSRRRRVPVLAEARSQP